MLTGASCRAGVKASSRVRILGGKDTMSYQGLIPQGVDRFQVVAAHYLWNSHHHGGQNSPEYARLSRISSYFRPSPLMNDDISRGDETVAEIYLELCRRNHVGCSCVEEYGA